MLSKEQSEFALQTFLGSLFLCKVTDLDLAYFESVFVYLSEYFLICEYSYFMRKLFIERTGLLFNSIIDWSCPT